MQKPGRERFLLLFFAAGTFVMIFVMAVSGKPLKTHFTPHGIIDLEFAYSKLKVLNILSNWKENVVDKVDRISTAKINTYLDFIFLFFYAPFLFLCCKKLHQVPNLKNNKTAGLLIGKGALLAGAMDILENTGMLKSLQGSPSQSIAMFTTAASVIKWTLVFAAIIFIIGRLSYRLFKRLSISNSVKLKTPVD